MSSATLPVWALVVIPLGSAAVGALSGPVTEKLRSASEWRNRQADREVVAQAKNDDIQQATIVQLLTAMDEAEVAAGNDALRDPETPNGPQAEAALRVFFAALSRADSLRVRIADEKGRDLTRKALDAVADLGNNAWGLPPLDERIDTFYEAQKEMRERLGSVYRSLMPTSSTTATRRSPG
jgi:hypothetical protein